MKSTPTTPTTQFVTFQKNVIVHLYHGIVTEFGRGSYIDSYTITYKKFFKLKLNSFYFNNECKDTLQARLRNITKAGYRIELFDNVSFKYKAIKK